MSVSGGYSERVDVQVQGDIPYQAHRWAVTLIDRAVRRGPWGLVQARVRLTRPPHLVATCRADIQADLGGHLFHTRAEAREPRTALELAAERLRRQAASLHAAQSPDKPHR
jgi:hypothetical protein